MEVLLILRPNGHRYDALVDGTMILTSDQPIVDSARWLLANGHPKKTILRVRHEGASFDAFLPAPISEWAKWSFTESSSRPLHRRPFVEFPAPCTGKAKSGGSDEGAGR